MNVCDLCGYPIVNDIVIYNYFETYSTIKFKAKKYGRSGWQKETIHICPYCQIKIKNTFRGKNK